MEKTYISTGKTIDLAIEAALQTLNLERDSVSVMVLQQAKTGFLGFGAQNAKIQVTYEVPDPEPEEKPAEVKSALGAASRSKPKQAYVAPRPEEPKPQTKPAAKAEQPKPQTKPAANAEQPKPPMPKKERAPKSEPAPKIVKEFTPAPSGSTEEQIEIFLKGLLEHMGAKAVPHCEKGENGYHVELTGEDLGYLIGHRGDTLDALQHLTTYVMNRSADSRIRVSIDAEDYREKREQTLARYARKKAQHVLKARRRTTLEPMNAYERHIVHAALQDMENITTHSVGSEPNRRVVIEYVK